MFSKILIGVDGRPGGRDALALAQLLATRSSRLIAVHVAHEARDGSPIDAEPYETLLDAELDSAGVRAEKLVIGDHYPGRGLRLATARTGADLLVLGSSHRGLRGRTFAGDTARTALHGSHCAVGVAVRNPRPGARRPTAIGVGFDGSQEARAALDIATDIARGTGGSLRLVAVGEPNDGLLPQAPDGHPWASAQEQRVASSRMMLAAAARPAEEAGIAVQADIVQGFPVTGLGHLSEQVDLLVVGSRAHGPARRTLLGSTADGLLHTAHCPVLVVPRGAFVGEPRGVPAATAA